jgi:hypothetical protein
MPASASGATGLELVDAHQHLTNLEALDYPWIQRRTPVLEALLDNYYDIARDYDVDEYLSDVSDQRLIKSVACEFGATDPVAEAEWIQRQADARGFPHAFVAAVDLTSPSLGEVLAIRRNAVIRTFSDVPGRFENVARHHVSFSPCRGTLCPDVDAKQRVRSRGLQDVDQQRRCCNERS